MDDKEGKMHSLRDSDDDSIDDSSDNNISK